MKLGTAISISQLDQMITIIPGSAGSSPRQFRRHRAGRYNGEYTINSGDTVVIAGMKTHTVSKNDRQGPLVGGHPGTRQAFPQLELTASKTIYLTIFITATILDGEQQPQDSGRKPDTQRTAFPMRTTLADRGAK